MQKAILYFIIMFNLLACREKSRELNILVPLGFRGKVTLIHNIDSSSNHYLKHNDDFYVLILNNKELPNVSIGDPPTPGGPYQYNVFYYSTDTLFQVASVSSANLKNTQINKVIRATGLTSKSSYGVVKEFVIDSLQNFPRYE